MQIFSNYLPVVLSSSLAQAEREAFKEGVSEEELLLQAGKQVASFALSIIEKENLPHHVTLLVGKGNNGADAFVAGIELIKGGCVVTAIQIDKLDDCSALNRKYAQKFYKQGGKIVVPTSKEELSIKREGLAIDGLYGAGFSGRIKGLHACLVDLVNRLPIKTIAIDLPSGVHGDSGKVEGIAVCADYTLTLTLPKLGLYLAPGWNFSGKVEVIPIGLEEKYIANIETFFDIPHYLNTHWPINRSRHKYQAGVVIAIAGSEKMPGAAKLSSISSMRSGAGIVFLCYPIGAQMQMSDLSWEIIRHPIIRVEEMDAVMEKAHSFYIGPGLGRDFLAQSLVMRLLEEKKRPVVWDADALYFLKEKINELGENSILTPHRGEMHHLLGKKEEDEKCFLNECKRFQRTYGGILLVKGSPSYLFSNRKNGLLLPWGDPGMATAGSGDVLTGIIGALLAQKWSSYEATLLGMRLHSSSGEKAARKKGSFSMIAKDIIDELPAAFSLNVNLRECDKSCTIE